MPLHPLRTARAQCETYQKIHMHTQRHRLVSLCLAGSFAISGRSGNASGKFSEVFVIVSGELTVNFPSEFPSENLNKLNNIPPFPKWYSNYCWIDFEAILGPCWRPQVGRKSVFESEFGWWEIFLAEKGTTCLFSLFLFLFLSFFFVLLVFGIIFRPMWGAKEGILGWTWRNAWSPSQAIRRTRRISKRRIQTFKVQGSFNN